MLKSDFHFDLPETLIAQAPLESRSDSRLLVLEAGLPLRDLQFKNLIEFLNPGDLLVLNDTRVIPARLYGNKVSGGRIEILIERLLDAHSALVHLRASKSPKAGARILLDGGFCCEVIDRRDSFFVVRFDVETPVLQVLEAVGHMPLPPYIDRADTATDRERYQTVFSATPGAVAAPTAGLHFDRNLLEAMQKKGIDQATITLHVGSGTFLPVRVDNLDEHQIHAEICHVSPETVSRIGAVKSRGGRVVAVGTTVVRALETAAGDGTLSPFHGETRIFIQPGYDFQVVDALVTNFHLPESTLLALVSAFGGHRAVMAAYAHAVREKYRFFSYGDAMFLTRQRMP